MLQRERHAERQQFEDLLFDNRGKSNHGLRRDDPGNRPQRRAIQSRRRAHFHLAGNVQVMRRIRPRIILAVLREGGKSRDGKQQKHDAYTEIKEPGALRRCASGVVV